MRVFLSLMAFLCGTVNSFAANEAKQLEGKVSVDGSSTVFPITEAVAEEFRSVQGKVKVTVGVSGTGGGFKKFIAGEIDINDASRPIKDKEIDAAKKAGLQYVELPVAYDGLSVVVNHNNTWADYLSVEELNNIWKPGSNIKKWKDLRPEWPDLDIKLFGPGTDSGTFDYFTEVINGEAQKCRSDFTKSEDDNVLVHGISQEKGALGFFGYAYYVENKTKVRAVPIRAKGSKKSVSPDVATIRDGSYAPLSRPVFIYVSAKSAARPEVKEFVRFYLESAPELVKSVGYVPMKDPQYKAAKAAFAKVAP